MVGPRVFIFRKANAVVVPGNLGDISHLSRPRAWKCHDASDNVAYSATKTALNQMPDLSRARAKVSRNARLLDRKRSRKRNLHER